LLCVIVSYLLTLEYARFSKHHANGGNHLSHGSFRAGKSKPTSSSITGRRKSDRVD
jgi:hypothetical protein